MTHDVKLFFYTCLVQWLALKQAEQIFLNFYLIYLFNNPKSVLVSKMTGQTNWNQRPAVRPTLSFTLSHTYTHHIILPPGSAAPLPPTTLTFTCHTGFIFTATTAHLPTLSPSCQSAASRLPPLTIHQQAQSAEPHQQAQAPTATRRAPESEGSILLFAKLITTLKLSVNLYYTLCSCSVI